MDSEKGAMGRDGEEPRGVEGGLGMGERPDSDGSNKSLPEKTTSKEVVESNLEYIQKRVEEGVQLSVLAEELKVNHATLRQHLWLSGGTARARAVFFVNELSERYNDLLNAENGLQMSKAREALNHMRHMASTRCREFFGQDPQIQVNITTPEQAQVRIKQLEEELGITHDA